MTATTIRVQMAQRKDTAANWTSANPILLSGEIGYETDTKKFKIGNGSTNWNSLAYLPIPDGSGNLTITGNLEIGSTGSLTFEGSTADGFETTLAVTNPTGDRTITLPDRSGTVITSGDTGTVTSTMLADGTIVNDDVNVAAAIAGTKISPDFGSQTVQTTGIFSHALGSAAAPTVTFTGDTNTGIYSPGADQVAISTSGSARLTITSDGDIRTTWGNDRFLGSYFSSSYYQGLLFDGGNSKNLKIVNRSGDTSADIVFLNAINGTPTEKLRITSAGLVGVGTSSPTAPLSFGANVPANNQTLLIYETGNFKSGLGISASGHRMFTSQGASLFFGHVSSSDGTTFSEKVTIDGSGRVGVGTTSPSANLHVSASSGTTIKITETNNGVTGALQATSTGPSLGSDTNHPLVFYTNAVEKARLTASGQLLVGTSSAPSAGSYNQFGKLIVQGNTFSANTTSVLSLNRGEGASSIASGEELGVIVFGDSAGNEFGSIQCVADATAGTNDYPGRLVFSTTADGASSPTQRLVIKESGLCGFFNGTPTFGYSDTAGFQVNHTGAILTSVEAERCAFFNRRTSDGSIIDFARSATTVGSISVTTTATAYNTSSDYRLKENVAAVTDGITRLQQLKPSRFNFIAEPTKTVDGFLAHEVQTIVPEAITGEKDAVDDEGNPKYQGIDQSKLVPLLTAALQEAIGEIESLKARVAALESV